MWYETKLTKLLKIKRPIIQAGMAGGPTTPELIATVSNCGGLGTLGAGYMGPEEIKGAIQRIKQLTDQPYAVNLFIPETTTIEESKIIKMTDTLKGFYEKLGIEQLSLQDEWGPNFEKQIEVIIEESVPVFSFTFGILETEWINRLRANGTIVIGTATTVEEALQLEKMNVDAIVAQGSEAGGHRGTFSGAAEDAMIGTMALVPQMVDAVHIPVIAAGGIMDGRGLIASISLGASAVQMGTAFLPTLESGANPLYKKAIIQATEAATTVTTKFSGKAARGLKNEFIDRLKDVPVSEVPIYPVQNALTQPLRKEAAKQEKSEWMSMWAGQGLRLTEGIGAKQIIDRIMEEANATLLRLTKKG
ncbi:NAD(P)H-dependent flavin oxidoreductase [Alkalihalobacterium alkalinitrilicum]|uniref:NAD(P)H-dependent flavin oxidoreductase n=1 Tax=Alkalihalobacterium alkalinitrilicum TaxID=427920 RepID=UPI00099508C8|nr:nitronate monooxygenase [Alkalihalobacterium alkalinitrilicum]